MQSFASPEDISCSENPSTRPQRGVSITNNIPHPSLLHASNRSSSLAFPRRSKNPPKAEVLQIRRILE